jgi:hypothetical protein
MMMQLFISTLNQNPFFSGGLSLMVVGALAALMRNVPAQLWVFLQRRLSVTLEVPDRDPAFRWLQVWLAARPYARCARDLSLATTWVPAGAGSDSAVVFDADAEPPLSAERQRPDVPGEPLEVPGRIAEARREVAGRGARDGLPASPRA